MFDALIVVTVYHYWGLGAAWGAGVGIFALALLVAASIRE